MPGSTSTPVVILRSSHHGGLGIIRSLGRLGIRVYTVETNRWEPGYSSRYCSGRFMLNTTADPPEEAIGRLLEIAGRVGGQPLLIPTTDQGAKWVADHAAELRSAFRFPAQDPVLVRVLSDKHRMEALARRCGVPTAQAMVPRSRQDLEQFLETAAFPVVVKATDAERFRRFAGGTKFIIHTPRELLAIYAKTGDAEDPAFLVQEFIPGEDWMFNGYFDRNSSCIFGLTGKKIRRFPAETGVTSLGICLRNETVEKTTVGFMQTIGYRGILDIGYRRDRRDGSYKVLDVNPRIGCTFRLFVAACGMDVARALYLDMTGQTVPPAQGVEGRKWIVEDFDMISSLRYLRTGALKPKDWVNSLRGVRETGCFAADDPLPFLMMAVADAGELVQWIRSRRSARIAVPSPQSSPSSVSAR
jgi:predicted ATP-grasp superfamily ATP-dependent carboligase